MEWIQTWTIIGTLGAFTGAMYLSLRSDIHKNSYAIEKNRQGIEKNGQAIGQNRQAIEQNRQAIDHNRQAIEKNGQGIQKNEQTIEQNGRIVSRLEGYIAGAERHPVSQEKSSYQIANQKSPPYQSQK